MNKKKAKISLVVLALVTVLFAYTVIIGIGKTGTGAIRNIILGLDLSGGVSITYQAVGDEEPSAEDMNDTVYKLQQRVQGYSTEASGIPRKALTESISRFRVSAMPMRFSKSLESRVLWSSV